VTAHQPGSQLSAAAPAARHSRSGWPSTHLHIGVQDITAGVALPAPP
jgi:hypothetical protein